MIVLSTMNIEMTPIELIISDRVNAYDHEVEPGANNVNIDLFEKH